MCLAKYKNLEYISLLPSRATLAENLQNRQNVAVSLAPRHNTLILMLLQIGVDFKRLHVRESLYKRFLHLVA
jgi:hypothetical protein